MGNGHARSARSLRARHRTCYFTVDEVESAIIAAAAAPYLGITELIALPHPTWESTVSPLKIAGQTGAIVPVCILGGVHAREWGSCDILINFIQQIEKAYVDKTSLTLGSKTFSATDIKAVVDTLDILVFPQANPTVDITAA